MAPSETFRLQACSWPASCRASAPTRKVPDGWPNRTCWRSPPPAAWLTSVPGIAAAVPMFGLIGALASTTLTFALGRGITETDGPAIRAIVRRAQAEHYKFSAVILGVVESVPFQQRQNP